MKKGSVINTQLAQVIADMGHFDLLGIGDAGMPVPDDVWKIDLAVSKNLPSFIDVLENILTELQIQKVYLAGEIKSQNPTQLAQIQQRINAPIVFIPHDQMKKDLSKTKAFIRTGEMTPYSNILLESGVTF
ncbi:D-ribose pyranase [Lacticaseibacillus chiayiensis]|uniref:D-ribose pyranase n=1 Tax=Lacticaseibacillus chiayiensis TaxID=2100821 RepID=A0A4Q1U620_9LACO|nr:D-ribose pyranase [Lacticaseibacillus chiayiensis]RXT27049.1 D-ribose pyranase [Lacticaseibacillus chiayiensis]